LGVFLTAEERAALEARADAEGRSISGLVARLIVQAAARRFAKPSASNSSRQPARKSTKKTS
jgi:hypothetical protein